MFHDRDNGRERGRQGKNERKETKEVRGDRRLSSCDCASLDLALNSGPALPHTHRAGPLEGSAPHEHLAPTVSPVIFLHLKISEPLCKPSLQHPPQGFLTAPAHTQRPPFPTPYAGTVHIPNLRASAGSLPSAPTSAPTRGHLGSPKRAFSSVQLLSRVRLFATP